MSDAYKYAQIYQNLSSKISSGVFRPGDKLPSIRSLGQQMGVAVVTVQRAYSELESNGLVQSRPKSGYFVSPRSATDQPRNPLQAPYAQKHYSDLAAEVIRYNRDQRLVQFGGAALAAELLPSSDLKKCYRRILGRARSLTGYEPFGGTPELKRQIERRALVWGGSIHSDEILVTVGGTEAIYLALRSCTKAGDSVAVESPTYFGLLEILASLGLKAIEVPTDSLTGVRVDLLIPLLEDKKVQACVLIPNFQNPTGCLIPEDQKKEIVFAAERAQIPLIELETSGDLYLEGFRPKLMSAYSRKGFVLSCISFSKLIAPGFRVGCLLTERYRERAEKLKRSTTLASPTAEQLVLAEFIHDGLYDKHLAKLRSFFKIRNSRVTEAVLRVFPSGTRITQTRGGYLLWIELPRGASSKKLFDSAIKKGISISPGNLFSTSDRYDNFLRLNCGVPEGPRSDKALQALGDIAHSLVLTRS